MITIFFLGIFAGIVSPLLRVRTKLGIVLAGGAAALTIFAAAGLMTADPREGLAAIEANRKEYLFVLACEVPVLILARFPKASEMGVLDGMGNPRRIYGMCDSCRHFAELLL